MSFPLFISKKYLFSKKDSRFITLISTISIIGIAIGVAALIISLSILQGFERIITSKIVDFESHIQITSYRSLLPDYHKFLPAIKENLDPYVLNINPYASKLGIISNNKMKEGANIKGIIPENSPGIKKNIVQGKYELISGENPTIIIGKKLADKIFAEVGDKLTLFALKKDELPSPENLPGIQKFTISGIFESGMSEYDDLNVYIHLKEAQILFDIGDNITGYDLRINDISKIDSLTAYLADNLRYPHSVRSIYQIHRNIFTWIELQKEPIPVVLGLIIIVAVFNIIGTLLMIVLEKTNAIGILKSIGAKKKQIILIFLYHGIFLSVAGIFLGNILSFFLMKIQLEYNIISLPSTVYFMSSVPIYLTAETFIGVSLIAFLLSMMVSIIPSYIASKIHPVSSLRFQ